MAYSFHWLDASSRSSDDVVPSFIRMEGMDKLVAGLNQFFCAAEDPRRFSSRFELFSYLKEGAHLLLAERSSVIVGMLTASYCHRFGERRVLISEILLARSLVRAPQALIEALVGEVVASKADAQTRVFTEDAHSAGLHLIEVQTKRAG